MSHTHQPMQTPPATNAAHYTEAQAIGGGAHRGQRAASGAVSQHHVAHTHRHNTFAATSAREEGSMTGSDAGLSDGEHGERLSGGEEGVGDSLSGRASGVSKGAVRAAAAAILRERVGADAAMDRKKSLRAGPAAARVCPRTGVSGKGWLSVSFVCCILWVWSVSQHVHHLGLVLTCHLSEPVACPQLRLTVEQCCNNAATPRTCCPNARTCCPAATMLQHHAHAAPMPAHAVPLHQCCNTTHMLPQCLCLCWGYQSDKLSLPPPPFASSSPPLSQGEQRVSRH